MAEAMKILIIEDSATQAKLIAGQLTRYHIDVVIAEDGMQGLRYVDAVKPDLIILDINLPTLDGYQVCYRLKRDEETRHIPVIMMTDNDTSSEAAKGLDAGADDYIPKDDFAIQNLLSTMENMGLIPTSEESLQ